jgi:hypothetical protein
VSFDPEQETRRFPVQILDSIEQLVGGHTLCVAAIEIVPRCMEKRSHLFVDNSARRMIAQMSP